MRMLFSTKKALRRILFGVVGVCATAPLVGQSDSRPQRVVALVGGTLIDGSGTQPIHDSVVIVRGDRIDKVGTVESLPVPANAEILSTEGLTVMPGLWDLHVHLLYAGAGDLAGWHRAYTARFEREIMPATAEQMLMAGVTSVRDMGAPPDAIFAVKKRIADGEIPGPTLYAAGPQMTHMPPDWAMFYRWGVAGSDDARRKATQLLDRGADLLKITDAPQMSVEEITAIVREAHARGRIVAAHGRTNEEIRLGLEGGVDEFEHIGVGNTGAEYPPDLVAAFRARVASGRTLYWTPTVGLPLNADYARDNREQLDDPSAYRGLPPDIAGLVHAAVKQFRPQAQPATAAIIKRKIGQLRESGVELIVGTDAGLAGNPHSQATWQELDVWVRDLGIDPMTAIVRATSVPAKLLGVERDSGTIAEGKYADIIAVRGDPLRHIDVLRDPVVVIRHGKRYK